MNERLTLRVWKHPPTSGGSPDDYRLHNERAKMLHALVDTLELPVENWGDTDAALPHEWVEIIVALGSAGAFTALVSIVKLWLERDKLKQVEIIVPKGAIKITGGTADDIQRIAKQIGLELDKPKTQKPKTKAKSQKPKPRKAKAKRKTG